MPIAFRVWVPHLRQDITKPGPPAHERSVHREDLHRGGLLPHADVQGYGRQQDALSRLLGERRGDRRDLYWEDHGVVHKLGLLPREPPTADRIPLYMLGLGQPWVP